MSEIKMKKQYCWAVEHGDYSDYRVLGVFTSEAFANAMMDEIKASGDDYAQASVTKWTLNPGVAEVNAGLHLFNICMSYDGTTERIEQVSRADPLATTLGVWSRTKAEAWRGEPVADAVSGVIWARDKKHAIKICNEFRVQQIALGGMHTRKSPRKETEK